MYIPGLCFSQSFYQHEVNARHSFYISKFLPVNQTKHCMHWSWQKHYAWRQWKLVSPLPAQTQPPHTHTQPNHNKYSSCIKFLVTHLIDVGIIWQCKLYAIITRYLFQASPPTKCVTTNPILTKTSQFVDFFFLCNNVLSGMHQCNVS